MAQGKDNFEKFLVIFFVIIGIVLILFVMRGQFK